MTFFAQTLSFIEGVGGPELMMILFVVLVLFGGQKLPEFARGFGRSMREFKKAASGVEEEFRRAIEEVETPEQPAPKPRPNPPPVARSASEPPNRS